MAAAAAKYGHCQVRSPVEYRSRVPFHPTIVAPLDFTTRSAELWSLDHELDRAALNVRDYQQILSDRLTAQPGLARLFDPNPPRRSHRPGEVDLTGSARRQFLQNLLHATADPTGFGPPWSPTEVAELHALLFHGLGLPVGSSHFRSGSATSATSSGETFLQPCPADRISVELDQLLGWADRAGPTYMPLIPAMVVLQGFYSIRPFAVGNSTVAEVMVQLSLRAAGLANSEIVALNGSLSSDPATLERLLLWTEQSGSYTELIDYAMDQALVAYRLAEGRWLVRSGDRPRLEEVALRLLAMARQVPGWFSAQEATTWVGGRGGPTVLRHLNELVLCGYLQSLGQTRAKRFRWVHPANLLLGTDRPPGDPGAVHPVPRGGRRAASRAGPRDAFTRAR